MKTVLKASAAALLIALVSWAGTGLQGGGLAGGPSGGCTNCLVDDGGFAVFGNYLPIDGGTVTGSVGIQAGLTVGTKDGGPGLVIATNGAQFNSTPGLKCGLDEGYCAMSVGNVANLIQGSASYIFISATTGVRFENSLSGTWTDGVNFMDSANNKAPFTPAAKAAQLIQSGSGAMTANALAVTFPTAFGVAPNCNCTHTNAVPIACGISTAANTTSVTFAVAAGGTDVVQWICIGTR